MTASITTSRTPLTDIRCRASATAGSIIIPRWWWSPVEGYQCSAKPSNQTYEDITFIPPEACMALVRDTKRGTDQESTPCLRSWRWRVLHDERVLVLRWRAEPCKGSCQQRTADCCRKVRICPRSAIRAIRDRLDRVGPHPQLPPGLLIVPEFIRLPRCHQADGGEGAMLLA